MLQLSGTVLGQPILSLRTGSPVATISTPILNPNNLKIEGFYCEDSVDHKQLILLYQDIRDVLPQGLVVDDHEVLADPDDLVRLKATLEANFELIGKPVETINHEKIGKVSDYAFEGTTMFIQKIYVSQSILKSFTTGSLSIDRTNIHEITPKKIIINEVMKTAPIQAPATA